MSITSSIAVKWKEDVVSMPNEVGAGDDCNVEDTNIPNIRARETR